VLHGQTPDWKAQGGQDTDRQWGFPKPLHEEVIHQDGLSLSDITPVHDTLHSVIPRQPSTPIKHIDLEISCGSGDNKHRETLIFEVATFNIGYSYIWRRPFLLKFMPVIHSAYATMKMLNPKGVITIKADQLDALAFENTSLSHVGRFSLSVCPATH
jgi:hypothetical protein